MQIPTANIHMDPSFRIIANRYPPVSFFERIADPADWEVLMELQNMGNPSADASIGNIAVVPPEDRITGPGAGRVMPSFTFLDQSPTGSRFSNRQFGAYYAAHTLETAIAETIYHRTKFMLDSRITSAQELEQLVLLADIAGEFHDIRTLKEYLPDVYSLTSYAASQALAAQLKEESSNGILYQSVRHEVGQCLAVLRPPVISHCREDKHLVYQWDGEKVSGYYEKKDYHPVSQKKTEKRA